MRAPDMRAYMEGLIDRELYTPVERKPNVIRGFDGSRVIAATEDNPDGARVSISLFQGTVDRVYAGEEVIFNRHNRSALLGAVLETMDEVEVLIEPRRARLVPGTTRSEDGVILPLGEHQVAVEGGIVFKGHRSRERDSALCPGKEGAGQSRDGAACLRGLRPRLLQRYGELGDGFIECHHKLAVEAGQRTTELADLAVVCSNCHSMSTARGRCSRSSSSVSACTCSPARSRPK